MTRAINKLLFVGLILLGVVASGAVQFGAVRAWQIHRSFPNVVDNLNVAGLRAPVTVRWDAFGIPQVYASSAADLFRAQGYLHAEDRFWEMDVRRHITSG